MGNSHLSDDIDDKELMAFSQELIRIPSVTFHESRLAEVIAKKLDQIGLEVQIEGGNVVATLEGSEHGKSILLCGHLDTIPVGNEKEWTVDPYSATISDGKLWGLGSADMKGGLASQIFAIKSLKAKTDRLKGTVTFIGTVLEETGHEKFNPRRGILEVIDKGHIKADVSVVGEPTSLTVARGHKGMCNISLTVRGKAAHSSVPENGINAIEKMTRLIIALKSLKCLNHPELGSGTLTTCLINGGVKLSVVPDTCRVLFDRRLTVGELAGDVQADVLRVVNELKNSDPDLEVDAEFPYSYEAFLTPADHLAIKCFDLATRNITGNRARIGSIPFGTDGAWINKLTRCPVVIFGPGDITNAHRPDEYVNVDEVKLASRIYTAMIAQYLS